MNRVFTWKVLSLAVGLFLSGGVICLIAGNTGMASALFVVAAFEGLLGAAVVGVVRARHKGRHPATP